MTDTIQIIDLFAGPGGLGEGFSATGRSGRVPMTIRLSIEKDAFAIRTLRQRAFLRAFTNGFPQVYYDCLNEDRPMPDWSDLYPREWAHAVEEARQLTLGEPGVFEEIARTLDDAREATHGRTVLIGGPPCQAYSLAGRVRNAGKVDYVPEDDNRHFLYREYVRILDRLRPAVFVMENVKGMLSSRVGGGAISERIFEDLRSAGDGYTLVPLAAERPFASHAASDFVVRSEQHGIPQARHRVILLGLRRDIAYDPQRTAPLLTPRPPVGVLEAIGTMPRLRSGLSRGDGQQAWHEAVKGWSWQLRADARLPKEVRACIPAFGDATDLLRADAKAEAIWPQNELADWLADPRLAVIPQHDTRSHMPDDLGRYMFVAAWGRAHGRSPKIDEFPAYLKPAHVNADSGHFIDRFRVQIGERPSTTVVSHIAKDGHYFIHPDPAQCRSLTVREAARLQTFPDNYWFCGPRTASYHQVGNAVPPLLARQIADVVADFLS